MAKIKLLNLQVLNVQLDVSSYDPGASNNITNKKFDIKGLSNPLDTTKFAIEFHLKLENKEDTFSLDLIAVAHFESEEEMGEDFIMSDFMQINAPAISFPYLRAFISNFTLNSGFTPIILPTFNFVEMAEKRKKKRELINRQQVKKKIQ